MAEGAEKEGDESIKTLTFNGIPVRKVQVCDCNILKRCNLVFFATEKAMCSHFSTVTFGDSLVILCR